MIHALAETYGKLPSQVLREADTFDMMVFDVVSTIREYHNKKDSKDINALNKLYGADSLQKGLEEFKKRKSK